MSEIEDPFILLEPSCDIHLVAGGTFPEDRRTVPFRVLRGVWNRDEGRHDITALTTDIHFDVFGLRGPVSIVTIEPPDAQGRGRLIPRGVGTVLVQVRHLDPSRPNKYEYLIARITVHHRMDGWWFGHERATPGDANSAPATSVFMDPVLAHTQPTLLALFDREEMISVGGVTGDITGHGYVRLTSDDPAICEVSTSYAGRLRGVQVGETVVVGELALPFPDVPATQRLLVRVTDPHRAPDNHLAEERVDRSADARTKLNLVFLAEGFTGPGASTGQDDRQRFAEIVTEAEEALFRKPRHEPFRLLRRHFNVWSRYEPSRHRGLTLGPELHDDSADPQSPNFKLIPNAYVAPNPNRPNAYSVALLLPLVGLPEADESRTTAEIRAEWRAPDSVPMIIGYDDSRASNELIEAWKRLRSWGVPVAVDTAYGFHQSNRLGDRVSDADAQNAMIVRPPAGPGDRLEWIKFVRRVHEWFAPRELDNIECDPRRYAPEYRRAALRLFVRYASRLSDARQGTPYSTIGRLWDPATPIESSGGVRHMSSAGLICVLFNTNQELGISVPGLVCLVALGTLDGYFPDVSVSPGRIWILRQGADADFAIDETEVIDALAHELGHGAYLLDDEYEKRRDTAPAHVEKSDNLTYVDTLAIGAWNAKLPTPIDPDRIKWAFLHRIEQADTVVEPIVIGTPAGTTRITVKLAPGRAERWRKALAEQKTVYLRRLNFDRGGQLPIRERDLHEELTIESIADDRTLVLLADDALQEFTFPPGSVLYIPKRDSGTEVPLTLVDERVLEYMRTTSYMEQGLTAVPGVSLSENHAASPAPYESDPPQDTHDLPPSIPGFVAPCQPHKVIGAYEGGYHVTRGVYRPAGDCKMRSHKTQKSEGEFCFVCKYLQVNLVDPSLHPELDKQYPRPTWWKRLWKGEPL